MSTPSPRVLRTAQQVLNMFVEAVIYVLPIMYYEPLLLPKIIAYKLIQILGLGILPSLIISAAYLNPIEVNVC